MKWLKHMTGLRNSEHVARFLDSTGLEGYGFYCMVREMIAEGMGPGDVRCELCLSLRRWSTTLGTHHNKVLKYVGYLEGAGLATFTREGSDLRVKMPNLAELRDEYARKSGHSPDYVRRSSAQSRSEQSRSDQSRATGEFVLANTNPGGKLEDKSVCRVGSMPDDAMLKLMSPGLRETFAEHLTEELHGEDKE